MLPQVNAIGPGPAAMRLLINIRHKPIAAPSAANVDLPLQAYEKPCYRPDRRRLALQLFWSSSKRFRIAELGGALCVLYRIPSSGG
jgi:hypothetical protein